MSEISHLDPSVREYVLRVVKADELRGEIIGQALIFERELNAWIDRVENLREVV
jgi:hypothetical protein